MWAWRRAAAAAAEPGSDLSSLSLISNTTAQICEKTSGESYLVSEWDRSLWWGSQCRSAVTGFCIVTASFPRSETETEQSRSDTAQKESQRINLWGKPGCQCVHMIRYTPWTSYFSVPWYLFSTEIMQVLVPGHWLSWVSTNKEAAPDAKIWCLAITNSLLSRGEALTMSRAGD